MRWKLGKLTNRPEDVKVLEVDYDQVVEEKKQIILQNKPLHDILGNISQVDKNGIVADNYVLHGCDLRDLSAFEQIIRKNLDLNLPTLVISEVVLVYMESEYSDSLIQLLTSTLKCTTFVLYEQIIPDDSFGSMMVDKLNQRGCPLLSIHKYPTLKSQEERFKSLGYSDVLAYDMNVIYNSFLEPRDYEWI